MKQHRGELLANGYRQNCNAKALTIVTGVTNKVRLYWRFRNCFTDLLLLHMYSRLRCQLFRMDLSGLLKCNLLCSVCNVWTWTTLRYKDDAVELN